MEDLDYWRIAEEMSIVQAALLVAECDPSVSAGYVEGWDLEKRPAGYEAAKTAIFNAFRRGTIKGTVFLECGYDINGNEYPIDDTISLTSIIEVESLRTWLSSRGIRTGFFFPNEADAPDYLDPRNPRYAPKLAAAVRGWQAVADPGGKSPKQALIKWLREHAADYGLSDDEGKPNETGIEEVAKSSELAIGRWSPQDS